MLVTLFTLQREPVVIHVDHSQRLLAVVQAPCVSVMQHLLDAVDDEVGDNDGVWPQSVLEVYASRYALAQ